MKVNICEKPDSLHLNVTFFTILFPFIKLKIKTLKNFNRLFKTNIMFITCKYFNSNHSNNNSFHDIYIYTYKKLNNNNSF